MRNYRVVNYYLGIDGGGTKTVCAVGDEASTLVTAAAGPSNIIRVGEDEARQSLQHAVAQACAAAGVSPQQIARTCIGAAGAARPEINSLIHGILSQIIPGAIEVTGDMQIALEAAFPGGPGIVVIAGTGSIAYGRDAHGNTARAGGWGFTVSDEGSAHWIGRNSVASILRACDRLQENPARENRLQASHKRQEERPEDILPLFRALQHAWTIHSIDDLVRAANAHPIPNFAGLLPSVLSCAEAGDELSRQVLFRAAVELSELAAIIIPRLFPRTSQADEGFNSSAPADTVAVPIAMAGGVFRHSDLVRQVFCNEVSKRHSRVKVLPQVVNPVEGALRRARGSQSRF